MDIKPVQYNICRAAFGAARVKEAILNGRQVYATPCVPRRAKRHELVDYHVLRQLLYAFSGTYVLCEHSALSRRWTTLGVFTFIIITCMLHKIFLNHSRVY